MRISGRAQAAHRGIKVQAAADPRVMQGLSRHDGKPGTQRLGHSLEAMGDGYCEFVAGGQAGPAQPGRGRSAPSGSAAVSGTARSA